MYKFVDIISEAAASIGMVAHVKEDPQEGPFIRVVNYRARKQIATVYLEEKPVKLLTKRVESQHTMNCLQLLELDYTEPFYSLTVHDESVSTKAIMAFTDNVIAVVGIHKELSKNGYRLWEHTSIQQANMLKLRSVFVRQDTVKELIDQGKWDGEVSGVVIESNLITEDFSIVLDTDKNPEAFWDFTIDHEQGRIGTATRIIPSDNFKPDVHLSTGVSTVTNIPMVAVKAHYSLVTAFNISYFTALQLTSQPGRVNTVKVYRCVDHNDRPFQLALKYNI